MLLRRTVESRSVHQAHLDKMEILTEQHRPDTVSGSQERPAPDTRTTFQTTEMTRVLIGKSTFVFLLFESKGIISAQNGNNALNRETRNCTETVH